jgi:hypothetical protein
MKLVPLHQGGAPARQGHDEEYQLASGGWRLRRRRGGSGGGGGEVRIIRSPYHVKPFYLSNRSTYQVKPFYLSSETVRPIKPFYLSK